MKILFLDLETTGVGHAEDEAILEVGCILYDIVEEKELWRGSWILAFELPRRFLPMSRFVYDMHEKSGLLDVPYDGVGTREVEEAILSQLNAHGIKPGDLIMGGFSPHFDLRFLRQYTSALAMYLHHRLLDISTLRTLEKAWNGENPLKVDKHRALPDCEEAIAELLRFKRKWPGLVQP